MKTGTNHTVLVRDLLGGDGPHLALAEDFVRARCTLCRGPADDDTRFTAAGYVCRGCRVRRLAPV